MPDYNCAMKRFLRLFAFTVLVVGVACAILYVVVRYRFGVYFAGAVGAPEAVTLNLPPGFRADVYARGLNTPRFMAVRDDGVVFVAEMGAGRVLALRAAGAEPVVVADGLEAPSSVALDAQGRLIVGEVTQITRLTLGADLRATAREALVTGLPTRASGQHFTRTPILGADGRLYVATGSSCNVCDEGDPRRAAIWVYDADGGNGRLYARGLRNAVGLTVAPEAFVPRVDPSGLWAAVMGRDLLGDDAPPETVYAIADGLDGGWPRCHAAEIVDPDFGRPGACDGVAVPVLKLQAHSAPLALLFYTGTLFPEDYRGDLFIAFHGSWNRSVPTGYKVVRVPMNGAQPAGPPEDFAAGWLQGDSAPGRPAGLAQLPDGSLLVSDDKAGVIYRISYTK
jgi:glucose/arabinose dehydrogenase